MFPRILFCCAALLILTLHNNAQAQEYAQRNYDIQRYELNVQLQPAANSAQIKAKLALVNNSTQGSSGQNVGLSLNKHAKVISAEADGASAQFRQKEDERLPDLSAVVVNFPKSLAPGATVSVTLNYTLELKDSSTIATIVPGDTVLLPDSFWAPFVHTPYNPNYAPDYAPVTMSVTTAENEQAAADGKQSSSAPSFTFEQALPSQPILLAGNFDKPLEIKSGATSFEFVLSRGLGENVAKQAAAIAAEGEKICDFYQQLLGIAPPAQMRIITSSQVSSYVIGNTLVLNEDLFRRDSLDVETLEFLARALLRVRIGGELMTRGIGWGVLQNSLPAYLAGLYFEHRYGAVAGREFFERRARAYAPVAAARNDGPLLKIVSLDKQYTTSIFNKGPLMFRFIEGQVGREKFTALLKAFLNSSNHQLQFDDLRKTLINANKDLAAFFDQWFDKIAEPDFIIGVPVAGDGGWKCVLRNLGSGEANVPVLAVTDKGEKLVQTVQIPSMGFSEVTFKTQDKLASVEIDPEKLYPQTNYDNDARPPAPSFISLFLDANTLFLKKDYAAAEAKLREASARDKVDAVTLTLLARTLTAQNKFDEAKTQIEAVEKLAPLPLYSITWLNYTLGEIALAKGQPDAVDYFRRALLAGKDIAPIRQKLIAVERQTSKQPPVEDSVKAFISQLDRSIKEATNQSLDPLVTRANMSKFVKGLVVNKPDSWTTEILREDQLNADKVAVDVAIAAIGSDKREQHGTAVFILRRNQAGWILNNVELFNAALPGLETGDTK
jgi:hypothetical protein